MLEKAVALALASAPVVVSDAPVYADIPQVRQVLCTHTRGTAFRIGSGAMVTAWHVASAQGCTIDGEPINVVLVDVAHDLAILRTKVYGEPLKIDCGGFIDGEAYAGVGMAHGLAAQRVIFVLASDALTKAFPWGGFATLWGAQFIPGMSGGPVFDKDGEVVGMVNGYLKTAPISFSQPLSDTPLCRSA